ncbi:LLM class flavin-dependent oxidoreductase [Streptomyces sp. WAC05858]|nr:LLM class flavin-dependent oxidoreductase [Streptomyces sp. WAC05858]
MQSCNARRIGVMFHRDLPPEELVPFSREIEASGADDIWVVEDLGWSGSIAAAATALSATKRVRVGIGIVPAPLRNPALLAMELATLARLYPGRLVVGIGHGVQEWMKQVGARAVSPMALLEETVVAVRSLLAGETVTMSGGALSLDGVRLVHAPAVPPSIVTGVVKPRSLELSGRVADGTIIIEGRRPQDLHEAKTHIERGRAAAGSPRPHEMIAITHLYVDHDPVRIQDVIQPYIDEFAEFLRVDRKDVMLAAGPPSAVTKTVNAFWDAGADTVMFHPVGDDPVRSVRRALTALGR